MGPASLGDTCGRPSAAELLGFDFRLSRCIEKAADIEVPWWYFLTDYHDISQLRQSRAQVREHGQIVETPEVTWHDQRRSFSETPVRS
jgi:hypothetical protein